MRNIAFFKAQTAVISAATIDDRENPISIGFYLSDLLRPTLAISSLQTQN